MTHADVLNVKCTDFLKDDRRAFAHKARRKKISLISVDVVNRDLSDALVSIGSSRLIAGGQSFAVEPRRIILRKLSAFTWDFLVYLIIDLNPVTAAIDVFLLLTGPIYNWRLRRHLRGLADGDVILKLGESTQFVLGFRGVASPAERLDLCIRDSGGQDQMLSCEIAR